jgi:hypothetical protein
VVELAFEFAGEAEQGAAQMDKEIIDNVLIDPNLDSYQQFFDHGWSKRLFEAVEASPLKDAVNALMVAWRSTNGAHLLPWLMVQGNGRFAPTGRLASFEGLAFMDVHHKDPGFVGDHSKPVTQARFNVD